MPLHNKPGELVKNAHEASKLVFDNYERARAEVENRKDQWEEWYKLYRSIIEIKDNDLISRLIIPLVFTTVEDLLPRLVQNRPRIEVWGRGKEDELRASQHKLLLFYFWDVMGMPLKLVDMVKRAEIYGTAVMKVVYRKQVEPRMIRTMVQPMLSILGREVPNVFAPREIGFAVDDEYAIWDDPWVEICELDKVFPDPDGKDVDSCSWIIHEVDTTIDALEGARKDGKPLYKKAVLADLRKQLKDSGMDPYSGERSLRQMVKEEIADTSTPGGPDPHKRQVTILEQWEDGKVITVVKDKPQLPPIRNDLNETGTKPFVVYTPIPDPGQFYGISVSETLHSLQFEASLLHSANLDNVLSSVHKMWKVLRTSGINQRNLRFRPSGVVPVKDMGDIEPLVSAPTDFTLHRTMDEIRRWVQKVGVTDTFSGVRSDLTGRTATEAQILAEASGSRAGLMFQILDYQTMVPLGRKLIRLYDLFLDSERPLRILGDEFAGAEYSRVSPEDLVSGSGVDLDVVISVAQAEPMTRQFRLMRAKDMLQSMAAIQIPINHPAMQFVLSELFRAYGHDRPEALLQSPEAQQLGALGQEGVEEAVRPPSPESLAEVLAIDQGGR